MWVWPHGRLYHGFGFRPERSRFSALVGPVRSQAAPAPPHDSDVRTGTPRIRLQPKSRVRPTAAATLQGRHAPGLAWGTLCAASARLRNAFPRAAHLDGSVLPSMTRSAAPLAALHGDTADPSDQMSMTRPGTEHDLADSYPTIPLPRQPGTRLGYVSARPVIGAVGGWTHATPSQTVMVVVASNPCDADDAPRPSAPDHPEYAQASTLSDARAALAVAILAEPEGLVACLRVVEAGVHRGRVSRRALLLERPAPRWVQDYIDAVHRAGRLLAPAGPGTRGTEAGPGRDDGPTALERRVARPRMVNDSRDLPPPGSGRSRRRGSPAATRSSRATAGWSPPSPGDTVAGPGSPRMI